MVHNHRFYPQPPPQHVGVMHKILLFMHDVIKNKVATEASINRTNFEAAISVSTAAVTTYEMVC